MTHTHTQTHTQTLNARAFTQNHQTGLTAWQASVCVCVRFFECHKITQNTSIQMEKRARTTPTTKTSTNNFFFFLIFRNKLMRVFVRLLRIISGKFNSHTKYLLRIVYCRCLNRFGFDFFDWIDTFSMALNINSVTGMASQIQLPFVFV